MKFTNQSNDLFKLFNSIQSNTPETSQSTINMLSVLCNDIREAHFVVTSQVKLTHTIKHIHNVNQIPKPQQFREDSFPDDVILHINDTITTNHCFTFSLQNRSYTVYFLLEQPDDNPYEQYVNLIAMWLYIAHKYNHDTRCAHNTTLYLYMTSLQKRLPKSNINILNQNHVNTAFTYSCPRDAEIVVFRKEEWFKVFIHETFHSFGLDFSTMNNDEVHAYILRLFDVSSEVNAYEGYTEFWAEIMNALFCAFYATRSQPELHISTALYFIHLESLYSLFQLTKILHFMGLKYQDLYVHNKKSIILRKTMYKEHTNVLAYYVIKGVLMANWSSFLDWCQTHNPRWLAFKRTATNQKEFCQFIERKYKSKSTLAQINKSVELLSRLLKKKKNIKPFVLNTMRMTICELG